MKYLIFISVIFFFQSCAHREHVPETSEELYTYDIDERLEELNIQLREIKYPPTVPISGAVRTGNLIFLSGNGPRNAAGDLTVGKVGEDLTIEEGYQAARQSAINHLCILKSELGDLNKVVQVVKVLGMVNAPADFSQQPAVINGYTELMIEVFGDRGRHARSAVGMASLPGNMACEVEAIVQVRD